MAILIMSAAVPWIGAFIATRSPKERCIKLDDFSSGIGTTSSVQSRHIAIFLRMLHQTIQKVLDPRIGLKIFFNVFRSLFPADAEILAQSKRTDAVNDAKINCLGISSLKTASPRQKEYGIPGKP